MNYQQTQQYAQQPVYARPTYQQVAQQMPMQTQLPRIRPVSSLEEVRASAIDFDGSVFFFPDFANKCIYTKQVNMDGTAGLNKYILTDIPLEMNSSNYVTREEFNQTLQDIKFALNQINTSTQLPPQPTEGQDQQKISNLNF